jgi:RimJ/RimL family protein N-acetyltransferase
VSLAAAMAKDHVRLEPLAEAHREALRAACAADPDIWSIYPMSFLSEAFDPSFDKMLGGRSFPFAVIQRGQLVGMTSYLDVDQGNGVVHIGRTYLEPAARGTGLNQAVKRLMLDRAFESGYRRAEFRVDTRNERSVAALEKLGAVREGILRRNLVTWTGFVRDTAVFSILRDEWLRARKA